MQVVKNNKSKYAIGDSTWSRSPNFDRGST